MYKFFIEWREGNTASSIIVRNYSIGSTALFLYDVKELTKEADIKNIRTQKEWN